MARGEARTTPPEIEFELEKVVRGFFDRDLLLDFIRHFILFENGTTADQEDRRLPPIPRRARGGARHHDRGRMRSPWHRRIRARYGKRVEPGSRKAGVFWHTQGSGKSISMVCYAGKLLQQREMNNPTLVVVTDRNDLDGQLFQQFSSAKELLKQTPVQADSREALREMLGERRAAASSSPRCRNSAAARRRRYPHAVRSHQRGGDQR